MNKTHELVLVGDIGGTNARFALAETNCNQENQAKSVNLIEMAIRPVRDFDSFYDATNWALSQFTQKPIKAVFALAAAFNQDDESANLTNYDWTISKDKLQTDCHLNNVHLVNDFAALAMGVYSCLNSGANDDILDAIKSGFENKSAPIVVLGPGTGLGMAIINPNPINTNFLVQIIPTEGGHQAFSPRNAIERQVLEMLAPQIGNISFEHLLSGDGLVRLYNCLCRLDNKLPQYFSAPEIGNAANQGEEMAVKTATAFALILASFCSNAVLASGALGGCIIAGGVAGHLAKFIKNDAFVKRFKEIGIMSDYLENILIWHNKDALAALKGAALLTKG